MKVKQLEWNDNITDTGRILGLFEICSDLRISDFCYLISFIIRNWKYYGDIDKPCSDKFFLIWTIGSNEQIVEFKTIEEAKEKAQEILTEFLIDKFFEK